MEQLEIEDDEHRLRRIQDNLEKLNASSSTRIRSRPLKFDRATSPLVPPSELLARVQTFLPQIEASNAILEQQANIDPHSVNMERVDDSMDQYIEMNLGLGVFEEQSHKNRTPGDRNDAGTPSGSRSSTLSSSSDSSSSLGDNDDDDNGSDSSSADTESSSEIITSFSAAPRLIRPLPKRSPASRQKPIIQVLDEKTSDDGRQTADV